MSMQQNEPSYQDMWNYFQPPLPPPLPLPPKKNHAGLYLGILGAVMLLCSFSSFSSGNMSYSLFFLFVSGGILTLGIFLHKSLHKLPIPPQPYMPPSILTDEEYERWVASKQDVLLEDGKKRLDVYEDQIQGKVLVIRSLVFPNSEEAKHYPSAPMYKKRGFDGRWHTSINRYLFLYPTKEYLAIFQSDVNALASSYSTGGWVYFHAPLRYEGTSTYFYDDIVGIDTHSYLSDDMSGNEQGTQPPLAEYWRQHLAIRISNGKSICATTRVRDARVEQTVQLLRILLREKYHGQRKREGQ